MELGALNRLVMGETYLAKAGRLSWRRVIDGLPDRAASILRFYPSKADRKKGSVWNADKFVPLDSRGISSNSSCYGQIVPV